MRLRLISLIMLLGLFGGAISNAQDTPETWYLRQDVADNNLVMYTLSGEEQIIGQSQQGGVLGLFRVSDDTLIGILDASRENETDADFYRFTPDGMTSFELVSLFEGRDDAPTEVNTPFIPVAFSYPYVVMTEGNVSPGRLYFALNVASMDVIPLLEYPPSYLYYMHCCRLSVNDAGDTILRYVGESEIDDGNRQSMYTIIEHNLTRDRVDILYENIFSRGQPMIPDRTGERWLLSYTERLEDVPVRTTQLLTLPDTIETLVEDVPVREAAVHRFYQNWLVEFTPACEDDCSLTITFDDGKQHIYRAPSEDGFMLVNYLWQMNDDRDLLIELQEGLYRVNTDAPPQPITSIDPRNMTGQFTSVDGNIITMQLPDNRYGIYDVRTELIVGSISADMITISLDFKHGYVLSDARYETLVYHPEQETVTMLESFRMIDILEDGRILYSSFDPEIDMQFIQLLDSVTGQEDVLYQGAIGYPARDLSYILAP